MENYTGVQLQKVLLQKKTSPKLVLPNSGSFPEHTPVQSLLDARSCALSQPWKRAEAVGEVESKRCVRNFEEFPKKPK